MAKNNYPIIFSGVATLAYSFIAKADTEAPKGATFKPDGKFKGTLVFDDAADAENIRDACIELLNSEFGDKLPPIDECHLPVHDGNPEKADGEFAGKTLVPAKSDYRPTIYDATNAEVPKGVFPSAGDKVRFKVSLFPFSKTETVKEKVNGKMVSTQTTLYGVSLRLLAVQIVEKGSGGGGGGFGAVEGGYKASADDVRKGRDEEGDDEPKRERSTPKGDGGDF